MKNRLTPTIAALVLAGLSSLSSAATELLNVSYDPTRELYQQINPLFAADWKAKTGESVTIKQSHGGAAKQARAVIDGLQADVVTLALAYDIDEISRKGLISPNWASEQKYGGVPYYSTVVFVVRKGNPRKIKDWNDLVKSGNKVITPNPKTSGGARWTFLAAWGYALSQNNNNPAKARAFVTQLYKNVPVLDSGARGATTTFAERGIGDVLLTWENEAHLALKELGRDKFEIVYPSQSILAEPPVAIVDKNVDKRGTRKQAQAYLNYLYTKPAQEVIAKNWYRPQDLDVSAKYKSTFPAIKLFRLSSYFGDWTKAQATYFKDGGEFDRIQAAIQASR